MRSTTVVLPPGRFDTGRHICVGSHGGTWNSGFWKRNDLSSPTDADDFSMMMISCTANYMNCTKSTTKEIARLGFGHRNIHYLGEAEHLLLLSEPEGSGGKRKRFRLKKDPHYSRWDKSECRG